MTTIMAPQQFAVRILWFDNNKHHVTNMLDRISHLLDITLIQALSYRIHYGKLVAESKFRAKPEVFTKLIQSGDREGIMRELTDVAVEKQVIQRVRTKAARYARPEDGQDAPAFKVDPDIIAQLYAEFLIPLNKDVQVEYLMQRLSS
jgi:chorismate mutase